MDFPSYVPNAVQRQVSAALDGDSWNPSGWRAALIEADSEQLRLGALLESFSEDPDVANNIRIECQKCRDDCNALRQNVACFERLALREEMKGAYENLIAACTTDDQQMAFVRSAWAADMNYPWFREKIKGAKEVARKIADAAGVLSALLRHAHQHGNYLTGEFSSVRWLLQNTNHQPGDSDYWMWQHMRHSVLGGNREDHEECSNSAGAKNGVLDAPPMPVEIKWGGEAPSEVAPVDPKTERQNELDYVWEKAPDMAQVIDSMQRAALRETPTEREAVGAALVSRKNSRKFEYLRAFASKLQEEYNIELTPEIRAAMAVTATVVLNDSAIDVTTDDVRKAIASLPSQAAEHSP
jgi:hypothetical protein